MAVIIRDANKFGSLTPDALDRFQRENNLILPEDYKAFLLEANGGLPQPEIIDFQENTRITSSDVHYLYGIHSGPNWSRLRVAIEVFRDRIPLEFIPIG